MDRFKVVRGSESGHCCFDWTVVDVEDLEQVGKRFRPRWVCECFEEKDAIRVAEALNFHWLKGITP